MSWKPALAPAARLRHCDIRQAELLIVPERIVVLNDTAAAIVRLCDGTRTATEISRHFPQAGPADVTDFLDDLRGQVWLR
ncbi:pyrroloquinoline quinone biosynthesis peptide chaperone PqqD [Nonomuraea sp. NPDC049625]|uniref:pyrroloquinoline quinone biosynthesis peptide chaperone PqqD n=1 Tax=Nonomuraea sp. NPDC049625 TaxID=3155775 RepID=UPI00342881D5